MIETQKNLFYGANTIRDGVNMSHLEKKTLLVMPSEIMNLPDLSCYVKHNIGYTNSRDQIEEWYKKGKS